MVRGVGVSGLSRIVGVMCGGAGLAAILLTQAIAAQAEGGVHLLPQPREVKLSGEVEIPGGIRVTAPGRDAEDEFAAKELETAAGEHTARAYAVVLLRAASAEGKAALKAHDLALTPEMADEGYALIIGDKRAEIVAESAAGVFYGVQTFKQLLPLEGEKKAIPMGTIRDWPAMAHRAIDDDLSRGPFPTLKFQEHQVEVIASFKANIYAPYFEHTLQYPNEPLAAPPGSAMTPEDVAELVKFAAKYHVTVLPEQEAFGHLHHVLKYDIYSDVAETPHGNVLAPGQPGSLPLVKDWFTQIAKEFPSPYVHLGADETSDLGLGRTKDAVKQQGYGPVYVGFLKQIHDELEPLHKKLLFWGDISWEDPKAVPGLPKDMIAVPWEYGRTKGFEKMIKPFTDAGMEVWVAPGDANWNEVFPDGNVFFGNIQGFIREGQQLGAKGAYITVWNDDGEGLFNEDWYGVLFGATAAWQQGESSIPAYQAAYGAVFHGDTSGKINEAEQELMLAHQTLAKAKTNMNSDNLFWLDPWSTRGQAIGAKLEPYVVELRLHAEKAIVLVEQARAENKHLKEPEALDAMDLGARRLDLIGMKWELTQQIVNDYRRAVTMQYDKTQREEAYGLMYEISSNNGLIQDLRDAYSATKNEFRQVWLSENRPYWLDNVLVRYDLETQMWQERGWKFSETIHALDQKKDLPSLRELGFLEQGAAGSEQ